MSGTITTKRGDTLRLLFSIKDSAGAAYDLSDCTARLQLRDKGGENVFVNATSDPADGLTVDTVAGTIALAVAFADTEDLVPGTYYADLELTFNGTERRSSETFQVRITQDVTQDVPA